MDHNTAPLRNWNMLAAILHIFAASAIIIVIAGVDTEILKSMEKKVYRLKVQPPPPNDGTLTSFSGSDLNTPYILSAFPQTINPVYGSIAFFGLTSLAHTFYGFSPAYIKSYHENRNQFRWLEYGITATLMVLLIALNAGVQTIEALIPILIATAVMQGCGYIVEAELAKPIPNYKVALMATVCGWALLLAVFVPILYGYLTALDDFEKQYVNSDGQPLKDSSGRDITIPSFVPFIIFFQLLGFALFGLTQLNQYRRRKASGEDMKAPFQQSEKTYIILSLVTKLLLAGGIGWGVIARVSSSADQETIPSS